MFETKAEQRKFEYGILAIAATVLVVIAASIWWVLHALLGINGVASVFLAVLLLVITWRLISD